MSRMQKTPHACEAKWCRLRELCPGLRAKPPAPSWIEPVRPGPVLGSDPKVSSQTTMPRGRKRRTRVWRNCAEFEDSAERGAWAARRPLRELVPVRGAEGLRDLGVRVRRVEDVSLEVAADRDRFQLDVGDVHERLARKLRLRDRVVLELEVRRVLHELVPVRAGSRAHVATVSVGAPISSPDHRPSSRTTPRSSPAG